MTITKTLINMGPHSRNYMASQRVAGIPDPVVAISHTRATAIAMCGLKVDAAISALKRRKVGVLRLPVLSFCRHPLGVKVSLG